MKNNKHGRGIFPLSCLLCLAAIVCFGKNGEAGKLKAYSAKQVHVKNGKEEPAGNLYVAPEMMRMEMPAPDRKDKMIMIFREDRGITYMVFPAKKIYIEKPLASEELGKTMGAFRRDMKRKEVDLGTETVNGYVCEKKRFETEMNIMGWDRVLKTTVWVSDKFDFPLRTENREGQWTEMRDIKPGKQPPDLFEIPSGYKKAANLMEVMTTGPEDQIAPGGIATPGGRRITPDQLPERLRELLYGTNGMKKDNGPESKGDVPTPNP